MIDGLVRSDEQQDFATAVRRLLSDRQPLNRVAELSDGDPGWDRDLLRRFAQDLGLQGCVIPERYGGSGFSQLELAAAFEELGYGLLCGPFFASVALAANALANSDDEDAKQRLLPGLAEGDLIATLAWNDDGLTPHAVVGPLELAQSEPAVTGVARNVLGAADADVLLVVCGAAEAPTLVEVDVGASGLEITPSRAIDSTRAVAEVRFDGVRGQLIGERGGASRMLRRGLDLARVALAAEQVGVAQRCLDMSVEYAGARNQFGRPIGSFQAVKHICAQMVLDVESSRSAARYAAVVAAGDGEDSIKRLPFQASVAQSFCSDAAYDCAAACIQVHGGIGYTWEHEAHLLFKRAHSSRMLLGEPDYHRERVISIQEAY